MSTKTGKIVAIEPAVPPTYESKYGTMHSYFVSFADGNRYKFSAKGEFKKKVGEEIKYNVTNEQYKNASIEREPYQPQSYSSTSNGINKDEWILLQVCYKENMQALARDHKDLVMAETRQDFKDLLQMFKEETNG